VHPKETKNWIWDVSKEKAKQYTLTEITECNKRYIVRKMLASLLSLIAKELNQTPTCKNWLILLFQKIDITKFLWGRLGGIAPTTFWPCRRSPPSPPWSRRLCDERVLSNNNIAATLVYAAFFWVLLMGLGYPKLMFWQLMDQAEAVLTQKFWRGNAPSAPFITEFKTKQWIDPCTFVGTIFNKNKKKWR